MNQERDDKQMLHILLIEDSPAVSRLLEQLLIDSVSSRFEWIHADTLKKGLHCLTEKTVEIVLLDLNLSDSSGLESYVKVRDHSPHIAIIILTGNENEDLAKYALQQGAQDYIVKDRVDGHLLYRSISYAMERNALLLKLKESKKAFQQSEGRFRSLIASLTEGILVIDQKGIIRYSNPAAGVLFGKRAEELIGSSFDVPKRDGESLTLEILRGEPRVAEFRVAEILWDDEMAFLVSVRDITERHHAEDALRQTTHKYESVVNSIDGIVYEADPDSLQFSFLNRQAERLLGYPLSEWLEKPGFWQKHIHNKDREWVTVYRAREVENRNSHDIEYRMIAADGRKVWVKDSATVLLQNDRPIKICGVMVDITDQKKAEDALKMHALRQTALNKLGRMALSGSNVPTIIHEAVVLSAQILQTDFAQLFQLVKERDVFVLRDSFGATRESKEDIPAAGNLSEAGYTLLVNQAVVVEDLRTESRFSPSPQLLEQKAVSGITAVIQYNDFQFGVLGVHTRKKRIFSSEEVSFLQAMANVIANAIGRSETDKLLRQSEEKYRTLFEESRDAIFISTPEGKVIDINRAGIEMFGFSSKEEFLKISSIEQLYWSPTDRQQYRAVVERDGFVKDYEVVMKSKMGNKIVVQETSTIVRDADGLIHAYRGTLRDVTRLKQLQEQLLQSQKMETIGQLAGGVAHDFNNLLMAITGYADLALLKTNEDDPIRRDVQGIARAAEQGAALTHQLLAFSRKQVLTPKVIDLNQLISNMKSLLHRLIGEHIQLITDLDRSLGHVKADPVQMEQVLMNLAVNARDAMPDGGRLIIKSSNQRVVPGDRLFELGITAGEYVKIGVSDTGSGMSEVTLSRIFEPFFTTKEKGTGLGLATVYGIMKQSGGHVDVRSAPGQGTQFFLYLPSLEEPVALLPSLHELPQAGNHETILLVDDHDSVRSATAALLELRGYRILPAMSAEDAIQIASEQEKIDLLITDLVMPQMGGFDLARHLRAMRPDLKVLYMSGYSEESVIKRITLDNSSFIQKPASIKTLLKKIQDCLRISSNQERS